MSSNIDWAQLVTAEDKFEERRQRKYDTIALSRYEEEIAGIIYHDINIQTDRESRTLFMDKVFKAKQDSTYTINWKTKSGFVILTAEQIIAIDQAINEYIQSVFDKEDLLILLIKNAKNDEELNNIKWE